MVADDTVTDAEYSKSLFIKKCAHCHTIDRGEPHKAGPNLFGIMGKQAGTVPGFKYTDANKNIGITWTKGNMDKFLECPKKYMPGTKMLYPEIKKSEDRATIIAYLEKFM